MSEEDRLVLLRLTEQVSKMARQMARFSGPAAFANLAGPAGPDQEGSIPLRPSTDSHSAFSFPSAADASPVVGNNLDGLVRVTCPSLPDPQLVRRMIRQRQQRARFFPSDLFADPAWDMLLDLTAARGEQLRVSVTSLCIASGVPPTTALRWIGQMTEAGLLARIEDETDRRRAFITLTDKAAECMARFFAYLADTASP